MNDRTHPRAKFRAMTEGTQKDWDIIAAEQKRFASGNGARILAHLKLLAGDYGGFPVDRLPPRLQTATRAHRDGRAEDYVVLALLHDIADPPRALTPPAIASAILMSLLPVANPRLRSDEHTSEL